MKCFYHRADLDGHCSGAIVKSKHIECEMVGINYGDEFPWDKIHPQENIFMVDFALQPFSDMVRLNAMCKLTWIDHHKSAIEEAYKRGFLASCAQSLEVGKAGCELTWDFVYPEAPMPRAVRLLGRYDVWDHSDPEVLPFQYGMRTLENTLPESGLWDTLLFAGTSLVQVLFQRGKTILSYVDTDNAKYAKASAYAVEFEGLRGVAINKMMSNSKLFEAIYDPQLYDIMIAFGYKKGQWTVSLYSTKEDVDCSAFAKKYGGGGHHSAAGFHCNTSTFMELLGGNL